MKKERQCWSKAIKPYELWGTKNICIKVKNLMFVKLGQLFSMSIISNTSFNSKSRKDNSFKQMFALAVLVILSETTLGMLLCQAHSIF